MQNNKNINSNSLPFIEEFSIFVIAGSAAILISSIGSIRTFSKIKGTTSLHHNIKGWLFCY
jgi:hypothetical protein